MTASWSKTIQSVGVRPTVLFLPTKQSVRPIYSHDNAIWKSSIYKLAAQTHHQDGCCDSFEEPVMQWRLTNTISFFIVYT